MGSVCSVSGRTHLDLRCASATPPKSDYVQSQVVINRRGEHKPMTGGDLSGLKDSGYFVILPRLVRPHHGIQTNQQLAGTGNQRHALFFSIRPQVLIVGADGWIVSPRTHRRQVQQASDRSTPTPNLALTAIAATVSVKRC